MLGERLDLILVVLSNPTILILSLLYLEKIQLSTASLSNVTLLMTDLYKLQVPEQNVILYYSITNDKYTSRTASLLSVTQALQALTSQI